MHTVSLPPSQLGAMSALPLSAGVGRGADEYAMKKVKLRETEALVFVSEVQEILLSSFATILMIVLNYVKILFQQFSLGSCH